MARVMKIRIKRSIQKMLVLSVRCSRLLCPSRPPRVPSCLATHPQPPGRSGQPGARLCPCCFQTQPRLHNSAHAAHPHTDTCARTRPAQTHLAHRHTHLAHRHPTHTHACTLPHRPHTLAGRHVHSPGTGTELGTRTHRHVHLCSRAHGRTAQPSREGAPALPSPRRPADLLTRSPRPSCRPPLVLLSVHGDAAVAQPAWTHLDSPGPHP